MSELQYPSSASVDFTPSFTILPQAQCHNTETKVWWCLCAINYFRLFVTHWNTFLSGFLPRMILLRLAKFLSRGNSWNVWTHTRQHTPSNTSLFLKKIYHSWVNYLYLSKMGKKICSGWQIAKNWKFFFWTIFICIDILGQDKCDVNSFELLLYSPKTVLFSWLHCLPSLFHMGLLKGRTRN